MTTKRRKVRKSRRSCKNGKLKRPVRTKKGGKRRCKKTRKKTRKSKRKKFRMQSNCSNKRKSDCVPPCVWYPGNIGCKERYYTPKPGSKIEEDYNRRGYHPNSYHREGQIDVATTNDSPPIQLGDLQPYYMLDRILDRLTFRELINFGKTNKEYKDVVREKIKKIKSLFRENGISDDEFVYIVIINSLREYISYHRADEVKVILRYFPEYIHSVDDNLFWSVFRQNNVRIVRILIRKLPYIDVNTALISASRDGQIEMLEMLMEEEGADVNIPNNNGNTPLMIATRNGNTEIARMLIDRGADVNIPDNNGNTPLTWASDRGNIQIVRMLIDRGANVNAKNKWNITPLTWASDRGNIQIVRMLIGRGAIISGVLPLLFGIFTSAPSSSINISNISI